MKDLLKQLISMPGACGHEHQVAKFIYNEMKDIADDCYADGLGNVIVMKKGAMPGPTLVVSTHADEVGFIVKKIEKNGLIRFEKIGGGDDRILLSQQVIVDTEKGPVLGVIGTISAHMRKFDNENHLRNYRELYIDVGAKDRDGVFALGVEIGDPVTWATSYTEFGENRAIGHGFDDRAGCAVLMKLFKELDFSKMYGTLYGVFSVQEEVGLRGASIIGSQIKADVALAVDTTAASDTPEQMMDDTVALGRGPGIKIMDFSLIASVAVRKKLQKVAESKQIPYQLEILTGIGTDAGELHKMGSGVPTGAISIPSRYAHSPNEVIDLGDLEYTKELLKEFVLSLKDKDEFSFI